MFLLGTARVPPAACRDMRREAGRLGRDHAADASGQDVPRDPHEVLGGDPKRLHHLGPGCREAETLDRDHRALRPHPAIPAERHARLDADARGHRGREDLLAVRRRLRLEELPARQRDDARGHSLALELCTGLNRELQLRAGGEQDEAGLRGDAVRPDRLGEYVAAAGHPRRRVLAGPVEHGQLLAAEGQGHGAVRAGHGRAPGGDGLVRIAGAHQPKVRHGPQRRDMLDRLVGGPVLAQPDRVVGPHVDHVQTTQRGEADAAPHVVAEGEEGADVGQAAAVVGDPVGDAAHSMLPHAEPDVAGRAVARAVLSAIPDVGQVALRKVRRAAEELGDGLRERLDRGRRRLAGRLCLVGPEGGERAIPALRQAACEASFELRSFAREGTPVGVEPRLPFADPFLAARHGLPEDA